MKTIAQLAYEADVAKHPCYHDGTPRRRWEQLCDVAKWSWGRPVGDIYAAREAGLVARAM